MNCHRKSLTVFDRQGAIGAVSLPGKAPLAELFRDLPFGPDALKSPTALLNALVGSEVEIAGKVTAQRPRVPRRDRGGRAAQQWRHHQRHRLTLMTDKGLVQALLEDVDDAALHRSAGQGADRTRARRPDREPRQGAAPASRSASSARERGNVAISYVVAAPVWKTAYRLVLPKEGGKARLQGWAVVENLTGGDWKDVELVLVSGNPVALRQPLYTALLYRSARGAGDDGGAADAAHRRCGSGSRPRAPRGPAGSVTPPAAPPHCAPAAPPPQRWPAGAGRKARPRPDEASPAPRIVAEAEEASTQLLYRFPAKISLATGHTMMVPFVDREVSAARTWLYQPDTSARRPLAAVRLRNDGDSGLPAGIVTAYDDVADGNINFVGDAQLPLLSKGAFKFVTFALDAKTDIRREDKGITPHHARQGGQRHADADHPVATHDRL